MRALVPGLIALVFASTVAAGEAPAPVTTPAPAPIAKSDDKPQLGVQIDERTLGGLDAGTKGLPVLHVVPGSTAATLGVQIGDRITAINGTPTNRIPDLQAVIAAAKIGDALKIDVERGQEKKSFSGAMQAAPKITDFNTELAKTRQDLEEARRAAGVGKREPTLADVLEMLNQIEKQLPKAAEEFKKQYPNGDFDIKIDVHVVSDKTAKHPIDLVPADDGAKQDGATKDKPADARAGGDPAAAGGKDQTKPMVDHGGKPVDPTKTAPAPQR